MRIIAGEFRGRKLLAPETQTTRPITDRVKQSLFDILTPLLPDARIYDCFSGTGSLGLESLSRGAAHATFFEADRSAAALLKRNIAALAVANRSDIVMSDIFKFFASSPPPPRPADLIFLDPPYRFLRERPADLASLVTHMLPHLAPTATLIFRHDSADQLAFAPLQEFDRREYGGMTLEFLRPRIENPPPPIENPA